MTEPTTPAGRALRNFACWEFHAFNESDHNPSCERPRELILAIEEQARAEGRREAIREIRANAESKGWRIDAYMNRILDDVARHGRSSDPTEADDE